MAAVRGRMAKTRRSSLWTKRQLFALLISNRMLFTDIVGHANIMILLLIDIGFLLLESLGKVRLAWFGGGGGIAVFIWSRFTSL